ncbi:tetratricopeptide repeat protein [Flavobacterium piscinae]|uniref:Tetratricopeptide repeat protein n=1 Tax=Flavobacterium piscinae TaxID=2506424 RepID=A0A4Q1KWU4_9FLAO|nr:tetratricopeptide repeat protein [Flavobacterium piscinae]RXR34160.1 tetratricopeptide repeat protein [Flavobacterium piscinae]
MHKFFILLFLICSSIVSSQNEQLAQHYYERGEFEKALLSYQELLKTQPSNGVYFLRVIDCYQQLLQFDKAETALQERLTKFNMANLYVELGYNFQLQKNQEKADLNYKIAIEKIKENPSNVYGIASSFEKKVLLDYALEAYQTAISLDPKYKFNYQMAQVYGQMGKQDLMIEKYLEEMYENPQNSVMVQNQLTRFMNDEAGDSFNEMLRKALLVKVQKNQDLFWNQMLSWFFVQQKEYGKAFIQEKAIYKREPDSFSNIVNLAELAIEEGENEIAGEILTFILENTQDLDLQIFAQEYLMRIKIEKAQKSDYSKIESELEILLKQYGVSPYSLALQRLLAEFSAFYQNNPEKGKLVLQKAMELPLNKFQLAEAKMELADILLYEEKFNQALLYYSQIEEDLKNDVLGHEASLKAAKTSYFKADFDWALTQLKVLKSASTQLIANDALELFLLINDNTVADSTRTALKKFSKGDFYLYQNKNQEALTQFQQILKDHKGEEIEDETILRIGQTYQELTDYNNALSFYQQIIDNHPESIYRDEALFFSAEIYNKHLNQPEKAKPLYEAVLFNHQDSIHFVEARKNFRQLRGDSNL